MIRRVWRAFSLVELVLVIAIIGVVSAVVVPRFVNSINRRSVEGAARRLAADLKLARRQAMATSASQTFHADGTGYSLIGMHHLDHPDRAYRVELGRDCDGTAWVSVDIGGNPDLIFDMYGVPNSAATFVIRAGGCSRTITVDQSTGRVEIQE